MLVFVEGGKPENPEKNPRSKARTNNKLRSSHMTPVVRESNAGHIGRRQVLSPLRPTPPYLLHKILDLIILFVYSLIYLFEQVLSSAVQCSLTEDSLLKISQQKPVVSVKPEPQCDEECDDDGSDTGSVCSDCSGNEW